ncbi:hypothetical protein [Pseudacidovorax intermedius]|uniref:Lipoprotein n=1 Tax=Pseudacidovorax intermedius TaxID=433924 RepID=A0A147GN00_9BURK|nr:hypothetical protein [Pseudacidovorax intermedius]KTT15268.1 hypothetical protein NS331_21370 [Pseudacidovorax intermedius]
MKTPTASAYPALAAIALAVGLLAACSDKGSEPAAPAAPTAPAPAPMAPAPNAPPSNAASAPAPTPAAAPTSARTVPMAVQGVASAGLTVRVKGVELGPDATVLDVSASFASPLTNWTQMASGDTYLQDDAGNKLMLKRPEDNRYLKIKTGDTMEGRLVFLGAVPADARQVKLVINEGSPPDDTNSPGLAVVLPLKPGG